MGGSWVARSNWPRAVVVKSLTLNVETSWQLLGSCVEMVTGSVQQGRSSDDPTSLSSVISDSPIQAGTLVSNLPFVPTMALHARDMRL